MEKAKPRVLIADDETHIRAMIKALLKTMNAEVIGEASNGRQAVELFEEHLPDLLLLDINMPVKTGEEALAQIVEKHPDALVIMITSLADADSVERCMDLGAANFLRKDTPLEEMKVIIRDTFREFRDAVNVRREEEGE